MWFLDLRKFILSDNGFALLRHHLRLHDFSNALFLSTILVKLVDSVLQLFNPLLIISLLLSVVFPVDLCFLEDFNVLAVPSEKLLQASLGLQSQR